MLSLIFNRFAFMSITNSDVAWVEATEEVVITEDGSPSENTLPGMI